MTLDSAQSVRRLLVPGVNRIAVLRANSIGDFVLALPALEALRAAYPDAEITYLGGEWHPQLMAGRPGPWDRVEIVPLYAGVRGADPASKSSAQVRRFFKSQRQRNYDLAVQIHGGGANSNPFVAALGARLTVGLRDVDAPALDRWIRYRDLQHEVHRFLEVVSLVGAVPVGFEPRLELTDADAQAAAAVLSGDPAGAAVLQEDAPAAAPPPADAAAASAAPAPAGRAGNAAVLPADGPLVAVHPGANDPRRRWPTENFAAVADALSARGARLLLVGDGAADEKAARTISRATKSSPLNLVGQLSLGGMLGVLSRCALIVANDSGPRHLAAAVGTSTVGIYWWRNLLNVGPLTAARHRVAVSRRTACPVCGAEQITERCPHDVSFVDDVHVDEVLAAALDLLESEPLEATYDDRGGGMDGRTTRG